LHKIGKLYFKMANSKLFLCIFFILYAQTLADVYYSCKNFTISDTVIEAFCKADDGTDKKALLDLQTCFTNVNGVLTYKPNNKEGFMTTCGFFILFINNIGYIEYNYTCLTDDRRNNNGSIHLNEYLVNKNGELVCEKVSVSFIE
jgi:hypothetical protein